MIEAIIHPSAYCKQLAFQSMIHVSILVPSSSSTTCLMVAANFAPSKTDTNTRLLTNNPNADR